MIVSSDKIARRGAPDAKLSGTALFGLRTGREVTLDIEGKDPARSG